MKLLRPIYVALVGAAIVVISCADPVARVAAPLHPPPAADLLGSLLNPTGLIACTPLAADSVSQAIGPNGGTINVGPHTFTVPAGALDSTVVITAVAPSDSVNRVSFEPTGLTFQQPALLTMSYSNCGLLGNLLPHHVVQIDASLLILDLLPSNLNVGAQTITGHVKHFSDYAVAW